MQSYSICDETGWYEEQDDDGNGTLVIFCEGVEVAKVPSSKIGSNNWKWLKVNNKLFFHNSPNRAYIKQHF